ncbi:ABC-type Mn2+/Zn2+ transport system permease subunit [Nocardia transvalensis]|uniref:ABC-type Mn2+/Zn2+ transport system permease subunit n=1 Tax=Nocardia transvalensis TaxID=37333 RepID=A0A7W9PJL4_9NOCA|nr:zinc ABC transporter permease AztB [Nocardia transvalensis]MBB5917377.1 ABC-type Mn2+/Zn2+ transport system permease subunit [Nocardia transvalensis]
MDVLFAPFEVSFVQRALWGGLLVSCVCALAGTWVVVRGMAFLGDAMAHGMLPGVAVASLLGGDLLLGAACSAAAMALGVTALQRNPRFGADTGIGLVFVGMLAAGVIIVSRSQSFAVDVTGFLFGDVLAIRERDLVYLAVALAVSVVIAGLGHRAFVALAFDPRKAHTLGLRPRWAQAALLALLTVAIVASFHVAGTLLVFGLLIAPPAAAIHWADRIPVIMLLAALIGGFSTVTGLLISWHAGTAAGATVVAVAVAVFFVSVLAARVRERVRRGGLRAANTVALLGALVAVLPVVGCGSDTGDSAPVTPVPHGYVEGAEETDAPQTRVVVADSAGAVRVVDLIDEKVTEAGKVPGATGIHGDDRFAYISSGASADVVDGGAWTVDHGDHMHYYRAAIREAGTLERVAPVAVHSDPVVTAVVTGTGTVLLDRAALDSGKVTERRSLPGALAAPYAEHVAVVTDTGRAEIRTRDDAAAAQLPDACPSPRGSAVTRRGLVFGCADGALVVTAHDGRFESAKIGYPQPVPDTERATEFRNRPGSTTLVARAGDRGVWVLDIRARTWKLVETGPVVATATAGEGSALLTLTRDGVLHSHDVTTGAQTAQVPLLSAPVPDGTPPPVVEIDTGRAYVNDAAARAVYEIDYRDNLRRARTFDLDIAPVHMVETGR